MIFRDRDHAARLLAERLSHIKGTHPLVLAIPRGAVPMGALLARELGGDLDVVLVRKIGFPGNPEYAIGAVDEDGNTYLSDHIADYGIPDLFITRERAEQMNVLQQRREKLRSVRPFIDPHDRTVIVVDDGIATGYTLAAALHLVHKRGPRRMIAALPVAPADALEHITAVADETVCLHVPSEFTAVGQFYENFSPVGDDEVLECLRSSNSPVSAPHLQDNPLHEQPGNRIERSGQEIEQRDGPG